MKRAIFVLFLALFIFFGCESGKSNKLGQGGSTGGEDWSSVTGYNCASIDRCVKGCGPDEGCQADCIGGGSDEARKIYVDLETCIRYNCAFLSEDETADCADDSCSRELESCGLKEPPADGGNNSGGGGGSTGGGSGNSGSTGGDSGGSTGGPGLPSCGRGSETPCLDFATGFVWSSKSRDKTWANAKTYCEDLSEGGFSDWRLPTISELRTLIRNCPATMTGGECGVTDSCLERDCRGSSCDGCGSSGGGSGGGGYGYSDNTGKYSLFGDTSWFWSSSPVADYPGYAWLVGFNLGAVRGSDMDNGHDVRCVR